jgi:hypothetical protein
MNAMPVVPIIDPQPVLDLIKRMGGECSFDDAIAVLVQAGMPISVARDALWQLLSDGYIAFTADRKLTVPKSDGASQAAG